MKKINPTKQLSQEDFCELFEQIPLNEKERNDVKETYWPLYELCLNADGVTPTNAWLATRNTFMAKEAQIKERMDNHD